MRFRLDKDKYTSESCQNDEIGNFSNDPEDEGYQNISEYLRGHHYHPEESEEFGFPGLSCYNWDIGSLSNPDARGSCSTGGSSKEDYEPAKFFRNIFPHRNDQPCDLIEGVSKGADEEDFVIAKLPDEEAGEKGANSKDEVDHEKWNFAQIGEAIVIVDSWNSVLQRVESREHEEKDDAEEDYSVVLLLAGVWLLQSGFHVVFICKDINLLDINWE